MTKQKITVEIDLAVNLCNEQIDGKDDCYAKQWKSIRKTLNEAKAEIEKQCTKIEEE